MSKKLMRLFVGLVFTLSASMAHALYIVAPNANETTPGSTITYMLGSGFDTGDVLQWVFSASEFSSISSGASITSIGFRANAIFGDLSYSQWDLQISSAVNPAPTLDSTFANNIGADAVTVYSGALNILASSLTAGTFFDIDFLTPYIYSGGDLLMTLVWQGPSTNRLAIDANSVSDGLGNTNFVFSTTATSGTTDYYSYPVTRFGVSSVPEPSTIALLSVGLAGMGFARKRMKAA